MRKKRLPDLSATGRRYVEQTMRVRLASPGIERYGRRKKGSAGRVALAALVAAALIAAMLWAR